MRYFKNSICPEGPPEGFSDVLWLEILPVHGGQGRADAVLE